MLLLTNVLAAANVKFILDFAFDFLGLLIQFGVQWEVNDECRWPEVGRLDGGEGLPPSAAARNSFCSSPVRNLPPP